MNRTQRLAEAILADCQHEKQKHNIIPCWACGFTFVYRGRRNDLNGNFCSRRCQDWHDAENGPVPHEFVYRWCNSKPMPIGRKGFYIDCARCQKEFESLGLRCCSVECERGYCEREENLAVMAEVGIEPAAKRRCEAPRCNNIIPKWRNGRQVSKSARFCSRKCQQRAEEGRSLILSANSLKKCPF